MGNAKETDAAKSLPELSPVVYFSYAVYFPSLDKPDSYKDPYRRYRIKGHAKAAMRWEAASVLYFWNDESHTWELV